MNENLLNVFIDAVVGRNIILYYILGVCPLILYKTSINESFFIGIILTIVMVISAFVAVLINFILTLLHLSYLQILLIIIIVYLIIYYTRIILNRFFPNSSKLFANYPEFFYTNYALYGLVFLNINIKADILPAVVFSFGAGVGYLIITVIFMAIKERLGFARKTNNLENIYLGLIILGLISLLFWNISGFK